MLAGNERIKTSIFLTLLMILMPFAAATSITTFGDGSSEVVVQFKDGVNTVNTTEGGFYIPSDETITSASLNVSTNPLIISGNTRVGVESGLPIWDPVLNNQATSFDNISNFTYQDENGAPVPLQFSSESFITDFESNSSNFDNTSSFGLSEYHDVTGDLLTWQYGEKNGKSGTAGPDDCASGDMCWGTTFEDNDYTDDSTDANDNVNDPFYFEMTTPSIFLDPNLNDTYLRFSSWHSLRKNVMPNGDYTFSDCAYVKIRTSPDGNFASGGFFDFLQFTLPYSTGISASNGFFLRYDSPPTVNQISSDCLGVPSNNFGLAGTSVSTSNPDGWAHLAANLAPYLGNYIQIKFVLESTDTEQSIAWGDKSGWYIDDVQIGESYASEGEMTVNNVQTPVNFIDKQPNGFGLLSLDSFEPGDSKILVDIRDTVSSQILSVDGELLEDLEGPVIELWGIDVNTHPMISIVFKFSSDSLGVSTPKLYGYDVGTRVGETFVKLNNNRDLNIVENEWQFMNDTGEKDFVLIKSEDLIDYFSYPIYGLIFTDTDKCNHYNATISSSTLLMDVTNISNNSYVEFSNPIFDFEFNLSFSENCTIADIWLDLFFGHHPSNLSIDITDNGVIDWGFIEPAQGDFGRQNKFWGGEVDGISESEVGNKLELDIATGQVIGGFFLLPKNSHVEYLDMFLHDITIDSSNLSYSYIVNFIFNSTYNEKCGRADDTSDIYLSELDRFSACFDTLNSYLSDTNATIFKTDQYGVEWLRIGYEFVQPDSINGGFVNLADLDIIYSFNHTLNQSTGFDSMLREFVASESQSGQIGDIHIPIITSSLNGGGVKFHNLVITTAPGYDSSLTWLSDNEGLYPSGEMYEIKTTHDVQPSTGSIFSVAQLRFSSDFGGLTFRYDPNTGFSEIDDTLNLVTLAPSSSAVPFGNNGGKEIIWRFAVNGEWDDTQEVSIFSETVAVDGVVGMLGGIVIKPSVGNAVENDAGIEMFEIYNAAGVIQNRDLVYSNQHLQIVGNISLEDINLSPDPSSYFLVVEEKNIELDGEFANVTWNEIANRSGVIGGHIDWMIDLGIFASGNETYRFRMKDYSNGDMLCPDSQYNPDQDCAIQFNVTMDILNPNLFGIQLYKRYAGEGDPNLDENWRDLYDESWAEPRVSQNFRIIASDLPTPPATAILHVWIEYDHDANTNGIAEESEYIQIQTVSDGQIPNATYAGSYNDYANSGLKGQVSLWVECYDLAGNAIDGGGPGLDNDIITYVSMHSDSPSIKNMFIEDSFGERFINNLPVNPPQGVGLWNQTI